MNRTGLSDRASDMHLDIHRQKVCWRSQIAANDRGRFVSGFRSACLVTHYK